ncbi:hypothetical protein [Sporolactobacillus terrae]|uniref:hypothetical protein n=1 Tax=Sporolactobacillus terrae TaxID=269673 RepID=UPI00048BAEF9|nr:hypothetical protein [Sporolactobacillus terrae]UAK16816.1 hypothetical protein K7399_02325 [Sporolactobacillus terrae]
MPFSRFDITLSNKKSQEALEAILYQYRDIIDDLNDELQQINPNYNPSGRYIVELGLSQDESSEIYQYFGINSNKSEEERVKWLSDWLKKNVHECQPDYVLRMVKAFTVDLED